jgi:hypothetical protein
MSFVEHCNTLTSIFIHHICAPFVTYQMRPPHLIYGLGVVELDVEVLVDTLESSADLNFVFEFDGDFLLDERFEETRREVRDGRF